MKKLLISIFVALLLYPLIGITGEGSGKVTRLIAHESANGGVIMFNVENHSNAPAACPSSEWAFSLETEHGKAMYSLLLTAATQKQSISVVGSGDCGAWPDRERPYYLEVNY